MLKWVGVVVSISEFGLHYNVCLEVATEWSEGSVKMCTGLFLTLLPLNSKLLNE